MRGDMGEQRCLPYSIQGATGERKRGQGPDVAFTGTPPGTSLLSTWLHVHLGDPAHGPLGDISHPNHISKVSP
jgi:hypothetical protein